MIGNARLLHQKAGACCATAVFLLATLTGSQAARAEDAGSLYGAHGVSPDAVRQGSLGSCYFHASIAALAKAAPDTLRGAIRQSSNGAYRVHFFDGPEEVVYPDDLEFGRTHSYDHSEGNWVLVLMRGYAQRTLRQSLVNAIQQSAYVPPFVKTLALSLLDQSGLPLMAYDRAIRSVVSQDGVLDKEVLKTKLADQLSIIGIPSTQAQILAGFIDEQGFFDSIALTVKQNGEVFGAYKSLGQGGIPVRVIEAFLGSGDAGLVTDRPLLMSTLARVHAGKVAMVAGTLEAAPTGGEEAIGMNWWVPAHSYSVLDYDEAAETISLRNPWGARPDPDGDFKLPLSLFRKSFEQFSYSGSPASNQAGHHPDQEH